MSFILTIDDELAAILEEFEVDRPIALARLESLAQAGHQSAILCFALELSFDGLNDSEATPWLLRAVAFGSGEAAWNLAMIARIRGDSAAMCKWIDRAAALGEEDAVEVRNRGYDVTSFLQDDADGSR